MLALDEDMKKILDTGIALTTEHDYDKLLLLIIRRAMLITTSDAGTLYLYDNNLLHFKIMQNNTLDGHADCKDVIMELPPVPLTDTSACGYCAIHREVINIDNVYDSNKFDFSGPRYYDKITGYHTKSMLVIPLINHENEMIGVLQLINALDPQKNIIPYKKDFEYIILSLASQAAVSVSNMHYLKEIKDLLYSLASIMAAAIDERTPYNANHTKNVAKYIEYYIAYINEQFKAGNTTEFFTQNRKEQLILTAMLHDIGKLTIPLKVMNKSTRLYQNSDCLINRLLLIRSYRKIDYLEGRTAKEEWENEDLLLEQALTNIPLINRTSYVTDEQADFILELSKKNYTAKDGTFYTYLTDIETDCLTTRKGTLTQNERKIMESHVTVTSKLLKNVKFNHHYNQVLEFASKHHEFLDGSGYPDKLTAENLPIDVRMLTITDIYEALTSHDRPYKSPLPKETSFRVLFDMAEEGKLDRSLVELFQKACERFQKELNMAIFNPS